MRTIIGIIVHHSAGPSTETVSAIRRYHTQVRKWSDIGYHYVIRLAEDGRWRVEPGRPMSKDGAHDDGQNHGTVGICICGDYSKGPVSAEAWALLASTVVTLCHAFGLSAEQVEGHKEHETAASATLCPGFDPEVLREAVRRQMA